MTTTIVEILATIIIFGDKVSVALLGALTLDQFGLAIDQANKNLRAVAELISFTPEEYGE